MVAVSLVRLREEPILGPFDLSRLLETHRRIFGGVYGWAGQIRRNTGTMQKLRKSGAIVSYGDSAFVEAALAEVFAGLGRERFLGGLAVAEFAQRAAYYYGELDAIHPFREGNSRTLRQFIGDLAANCEYRLDWTKASNTEETRQELIFARDLAVMRRDSSRLAHIFRTYLSPKA